MSISFESRAATIANGRVSVVIPCFNREHELPRAVASVRMQTEVDRCDIVVVDDGSTDGTARAAAALGDDVHYIYQDNAGAAVARNTGIWALPNEFVAFLDSDDVWEPETITTHLCALEKHSAAGMSVGHSRTQFPDGRVISEPMPPLQANEPVDFLPTLIEANHVKTSAVMVRRSWLEAVRGFAPELRRVQDYDLWLRLAAHGSGIQSPVVMYTYMTDTRVSLQKNRQASLAAANHVRQRARALLRERPDCRAAWRRGNTRQYALMRDEAFRAGRYFESGRWGVASLWSEPWGRKRWEWGKVVQAWLLALRHRLYGHVEVRL
jgi:glycosyltransferase involved in cell wall biosynthesis